MADINLSTQSIVASGLTTSYTGSLSVANTYYFVNNGDQFLHFKKTGAGNCTVTIVTPKTVDDLAVADLTVTVPATTGDVMIGPFNPGTYNVASTGKVSFTLSEITGLSVGVFKL